MVDSREVEFFYFKAKYQNLFSMIIFIKIKFKTKKKKLLLSIFSDVKSSPDTFTSFLLNV